MKNETVIINTLYRHFKGGYYLVEKLARNEADGEEVVVYTSMKTGQTFIRPLSQFFTDVSKREDNVTHQVHRLEPVGEIKGILSLVPTNDLVEELSTRSDNPYGSCKKLEEDENVWEVRYLIGRIIESVDSKTGEKIEEFKPLTLGTFDSMESARRYKDTMYPNRPAIFARRVISKIAEL